MAIDRARVIGGSAFAILGAIALLHAPAAHSWLAGAGGCPFAGTEMTTSASEAARRIGVRELRGTRSAPARPALGFTLNATTLADARRWATREHVTCVDAREGLLHCDAVPASAIALPPSMPPAELSLAFDAHDRLVNITTYRAHLTPDAAAQASSAIHAVLSPVLGDASQSTGRFDAEHLALPPAASIATEAYRYADYVAELTAMNTPSGTGVLVREQYVSARD